MILLYIDIITIGGNLSSNLITNNPDGSIYDQERFEKAQNSVVFNDILRNYNEVTRREALAA